MHSIPFFLKWLNFKSNSTVHPGMIVIKNLDSACYKMSLVVREVVVGCDNQTKPFNVGTFKRCKNRPLRPARLYPQKRTIQILFSYKMVQPSARIWFYVFLWWQYLILFYDSIVFLSIRTNKAWSDGYEVRGERNRTWKPDQMAMRFKARETDLESQIKWPCGLRREKQNLEARSNGHKV